MRVTIRLFARLRDLVGQSDLVRDVPAHATVAAVWDQLVAEFPVIAPYAAVTVSSMRAHSSAPSVRMDSVGPRALSSASRCCFHRP